MNTRLFIGALPLFDKDMAVQAYQMITRDGDRLLGAAEDFRMLSGELLAPALEFVKAIGIEPFAGRHDFFVGLSKFQLLIGMPLNMMISPEQLVCVIENETLTDNAAYAKLGILKRKGYRLAVEGLPGPALSMDTAVKIFDYILLSHNSPTFSVDIKTARPYVFKTRLVITDIPDMDTYNKFTDIHNALLSGSFHSQPITKGLTEVSPLKINALSLLKQINDDNFELIDAANIIERDAALSISLLRFLNAMNPDRNRAIESIRSAVAILGQNEVRKWATIAISVAIGEDRPGEITRLSLIRAKFAENLAPAFDMVLKSGSLFIAGLFSLLDVILQMPMQKAIKEVAVDSEISSALLSKEGPLSDVLSLIFAYERGNWHEASIIMVKNRVEIDVLTQAYLDSLYWYRQLLDTIDSSDEDQQDED